MFVDVGLVRGEALGWGIFFYLFIFRVGKVEGVWEDVVLVFFVYLVNSIVLDGVLVIYKLLLEV